jgi:hypothetical protein
MSANQKKHLVDHTQKPAKRGKNEGSVKKKVELAQMLEAPDTMHQDDVLNAQQQVGNQVVTRALDKKERRETVTDEKGNLNTEISETIQGERGGGSPLPEDVAKEAGKQFKRKFDDVRLHTDEKADQLSRKIQARAFTIGKDIFFKKGVFSPGTSQGRETLIHELTHVVQQSGSRSSVGQLKLGASDTAQEQEADRIGKKHSTPKPAAKETALNSSVQKIGEDEEEMLQGQEDEEELQMQATEDEELLQGQPETTDVVQRTKVSEKVKAWEEYLKNPGKSQPIDIWSGQKKETGKHHTEGKEETSVEKRKVDKDQTIPKEVPLDDLEKGNKKEEPEQESETKPEQESETKPEQETEIKPEQESETKPEQESETKPEQESETKPEQESETKPEQESETKPEQESTKPEQESETKPEQESETKPEQESETKPEQESETKPEQESETKPEPLTKTKTKKKSGFRPLSEEELKTDPKTRKKEEGQTGKYKRKQSRESLIAKIKDPSSSTEDVQKSQDMLKTLHKRTLKENYSRGATGERLKKLKKMAREGDKDAYKKYKKEYATASGREKWLSKGKGGRFKMLGKGLLSGAKKLLGTGDLKEHFFGPKKKEEKPKEIKLSGEVGIKGGGGGASAMIEEYMKMKQDNQKLQKELEELKKK